MKLFVTGGTGFVGSHVLRQSIAHGHEVLALRRPGSAPRVALEHEPEWIDGPLDGAYGDRLHGVEVFIHLASHTPNPPYDTLTKCLYWNVYAPIALVEQCWQAGVRKFVMAGSCFEYGLTAARVERLSTDAPLEPNLSYPTSKAAASAAFQGFAREKCAFLKILRMFQVYGEGEQATRFWPSLRQAALAGRDFPMTAGEQIRDFTPVEFVASEFVRSLDFSGAQAGVPTVQHVKTGTPTSLLTFSQYWWKEWQATGKLLPGAVPYRPNELMTLVSE